jgi:transglutaminase-like putative cysteine protease
MTSLSGRIKALLSGMLICWTASPAQDPANYSVPLENFNPSVFEAAESRFILQSEEETFTLPPTPYQKIERNEASGASRRITVRTGDFREADTDRTDIKKHLQDTRFLTMSSPEVKTLAKKIPAHGDPVRNTESFVFDYITNKTLGVPLLPAENIIRSRMGDCTEHTILTISLLRSKGIPARAVVGMLLVPFFNGKKNVFAYHMWAEAFHNGRWNLVDATRPGDIHPNRYIAFAYHSLQTEMPLSYFRAISAIRKMRVTLI